MLTTQEQEEVLKFVRRMLKNDRTRRTKVKNFVYSEKKANEAEQKDFSDLNDLLKELG